eukprot:TRINITY_DN22512_c0_g1_i1.p1 TRINITY_DN22512_c0_g1~~TRINITY_DN22512_c0_g1_i1.p1  ORF type:complete len:236 (-),score=58.73 TRINITY_DN22512_c0_g1_i1:171-878(-)
MCNSKGKLGEKYSAELQAEVIMNRIRILRNSQEKAERSVQVAHTKAMKLREIDRLKELELQQQHILTNPKCNKEMELKRIEERSSSLGVNKKKQITIESVFDNTISAIKLRIAKRQFTDKINNNKRTWLMENAVRRNKVVYMENAIREHLRKVRERNLESIKASQLNQYKDMQHKAMQAFGRLHKLELIEQSMIQKLHNTRSLENSHIRASVKVLDSIQSKQGKGSKSFDGFSQV